MNLEQTLDINDKNGTLQRASLFVHDFLHCNVTKWTTSYHIPFFRCSNLSPPAAMHTWILVWTLCCTRSSISGDTLEHSSTMRRRCDDWGFAYTCSLRYPTGKSPLLSSQVNQLFVFRIPPPGIALLMIFFARCGLIFRPKAIFSFHSCLWRPNFGYRKQRYLRFNRSILNIHVHKVFFCIKLMMLYNFVLQFVFLSRAVFEIGTPTPSFSTIWHCKCHLVAPSHFIIPSLHLYDYSCGRSAAVNGGGERTKLSGHSVSLYNRHKNEKNEMFKMKLGADNCWKF